MGLYRSVWFLIVALLFLVSLGVVTVKRLYKRRNVGFIMNHLGLFLVAWAMFFGAPDHRKGFMVIYQGGGSNIAYSEQGEAMPLPFGVELQNFEVEYYEDGVTPRQYHSKLLVEGDLRDISVNSPTKYKGYHIYQNGYDQQGQRYVVLQVVRDPWLWVVWLGFAMLAVGSVILMLRLNGTAKY